MQTPFGKKLMVVIACEVLQDELVHVLRGDGEVQSILLPPSLHGSELQRKLDVAGLGRKVRCIGTELPRGEDLLPGFSVVISLGPMSFHANPDALQDEVQSKITAADEVADSILLLYGLCGNALLSIDSFAQEIRAPVTIVRDHNGKIADDCVGMLVGERHRYLDLLRHCHGTFFMSSTWADNWRRFMVDIQLIPDINDLDGAKYVFQYMGYRRVVMLDSDVANQTAFEEKVREFAQHFGFALERLDCRTTLLEEAYQRAKQYIDGGGRSQGWESPPLPTPL